jgi:hypothetical protein
MALEASAGATSEARAAGSGNKGTTATLGPAMRALATSTGLGFAHFGTLAGVTSAYKCLSKGRLWLIIITAFNAHFSYKPPPSNVCRQRKLMRQVLCAQCGGGRYRC